MSETETPDHRRAIAERNVEAILDAAQALLERCPASRPFGAVVEAGAGEPAQDLLAHGLLTRRIRAAAPGS